MALKVTFNNPAYGKDQEVAVQGLGLLKNGKSVTLTEDQEQEYAALHGMTVREGLKDDENFTIEGTAEAKVEQKEVNK